MFYLEEEPVWPNGWVLVYELSGGSHLILLLIWKKLSNVVDNDVVRNTVLNTLLTKFRRVEAETFNANGIANKSQHGINKQNLGKKFERCR